MDDWSFGIPRKIFRWLLIGAVVIAAIYGVITWDSKKAVEFYFAEVRIITQPIINKFTERMQRAMDRAVHQSQLATTTPE